MQFHRWRARLRDGRELSGEDDYLKLDLYPLVERLEFQLAGFEEIIVVVPREGRVPFVKRTCWIDTVGHEERGRGYFYTIGDGAGHEWVVHPDGSIESKASDDVDEGKKRQALDDSVPL